MQRINPYNGIAYKDDPTILAWETGNELGGYIEAEMWPPASWTRSVVSYIRAYDSNHLIIDGMLRDMLDLVDLLPRTDLRFLRQARTDSTIVRVHGVPNEAAWPD